MTSLNQHTLQLQHGERRFTTFSNYSESEVFNTSKSRKWKRVIFLLHGFPDNNTTYNGIWPSLLEAFADDRVLLLAPLMRGYETTSLGPDKEYRQSDCASDVKAWIDSLEPGSIPVHLVGHDWGACVAYKTASMYPDSLTSIACMAIPYLRKNRLWEYAFKVPIQLFYSSYMVTMQRASWYRPRFAQSGPDSYLDGLWKYWSPGWNYAQHELESVRNTLSQKGVIDGATAYYRCVFNPLNIRESLWLIDFEKVPTMIVGGENDHCMTSTLFKMDKENLKDTKNVVVKTVPNAGHFLQRESPKVVAELIIDWIQRRH
jgi:Predicted hydrolases or acyltransferases (alpha/beta hydrolase superfamily)